MLGLPKRVMELLLMDWLSVLIYEMVTHRMLFSRFEVGIEGLRLAVKVPDVELREIEWDAENPSMV